MRVKHIIVNHTSIVTSQSFPSHLSRVRPDRFSQSPGLIIIDQAGFLIDTLVAMLCDGGGKYQSRLFNQEWLAEKDRHIS
jgi:hypothetical protein